VCRRAVFTDCPSTTIMKRWVSTSNRSEGWTVDPKSLLDQSRSAAASESALADSASQRTSIFQTHNAAIFFPPKEHLEGIPRPAAGALAALQESNATWR
jgi:hypothetical protein